MLLGVRPRAAPARSAATPSSPARWCCARRCCCCSSRSRWRWRWPARFVTMPAGFSLAALAERLGHERDLGPGCLAGGVRCGVAWNTLFLALLTAAGTTVLGTLLALVAERGSRALQDAAAPALAAADHHAAVRRRPRADPAVRPRRHRQPGARIGVRRHADALVLWLAGLWLAQLFAFTPIAFLIMRGVVAGHLARRSRRRRRRCAPTAATTFPP